MARGYDSLGREIRTGTLVDGRWTCTAADVGEALTTASTVVEWITITAETDNTSVLVLGASTVVNTVLTRRGTPLYAGEPFTYHNIDLSQLYQEVGGSGEGSTYQYRS